MKRLLKQLGLHETLDLELRMDRDQITDSLKKISVSEEITPFNLSSIGVTEYTRTYGAINERNKLPVHFDIYPRNHTFFVFALFMVTLVISIGGLGAVILSFSDREYISAFGALSVYVLLLFVFPIRLLKRMQWRVWDLRFDIEKELKRKEKQFVDNNFN